jgi:hypothetical protein
MAPTPAHHYGESYLDLMLNPILRPLLLQILTNKHYLNPAPALRILPVPFRAPSRSPQQSPVLSPLRRRAPRSHPSLTDHPPPTPPVSSCSINNLGDDGATALSSGLTSLTKLKSINLRRGRGGREARTDTLRSWARAASLAPPSSCKFRVRLPQCP